MSKKRSSLNYLKDMFISCKNIKNYLKGLKYEDFKKEPKTQDAVIRNIEILGEATKNISKTFKYRHSDIEWNEIAKTRDKLIHSYFGIDIDIVWDIAKNDIPKLIKKLKSILKKYKEEKI